MKLSVGLGTSAALLLGSVTGICAMAVAAAGDFSEQHLAAHTTFTATAWSPYPAQLELIDKKLPVETLHLRQRAELAEARVAPPCPAAAGMSRSSWTPGRIAISTSPATRFTSGSTPRSRCRANDLPIISLRDAANGFAGKVKLGEFAHDLPAGKWTRVAIPLARFGSASVHAFQPDKTNAVVFIQDAVDAAPHTLLLDDIRIENAADQKASAPAAPTNLQAKG